MGRKKGSKGSRSTVEPLPSSWDAEDFLDQNGSVADTSGNPVEFEERIAFSKDARSSRFFETIGERAKRSPRSKRKHCYTVRFADERSSPRAETHRYSRYEHDGKANDGTRKCYSQREFRQYYDGLSPPLFWNDSSHRTNNKDLSQAKPYYPFEEEASERADDDCDKETEEDRIMQATGSAHKDQSGQEQTKHSDHKRGRKRKRGRPRLHSPSRQPKYPISHEVKEFKDLYLEEGEPSSSSSNKRLCETIKRRVARDYARICEKATKCLHKDNRYALRICDRKLSKAAILEGSSGPGSLEPDNLSHDRGHDLASSSFESSQGTGAVQNVSSRDLLQRSPLRSRESSIDRKNIITVSSDSKSVDDTSTVSNEKNFSMSSADTSTVVMEESQADAVMQVDKQAAEEEEEVVVQRPRARKSLPSYIPNGTKAVLYRIGSHRYTTNADKDTKDVMEGQQDCEHDVQLRKKRGRSKHKQHSRMRLSKQTILSENDHTGSRRTETSSIPSSEENKSGNKTANSVEATFSGSGITTCSQSEAESVSPVGNRNQSADSDAVTDSSRTEHETPLTFYSDIASYRKDEREQRIEEMFVKIREAKRREMKNDSRRRFMNQAEKAAEDEQRTEQAVISNDRISSSSISPNRSNVGTQTNPATPSANVRELSQVLNSSENPTVCNRELPEVTNLELRSVSASEPSKMPTYLEDRNISNREVPKAPAACYRNLSPAVHNHGAAVSRTSVSNQRCAYGPIEPQPQYSNITPSPSSSHMGTQTNLQVAQYGRSLVSYGQGLTHQSSDVGYTEPYVPNQQQLQYSNVPTPSNYCDSYVQTAAEDGYVPRAAAVPNFQDPPQNFNSQLIVPHEYVSSEPGPSSHFAQEPRYHELMPPSYGQPQPENYGYTRVLPSQENRYIASEVPRVSAGRSIAAIQPTPASHGLQCGTPDLPAARLHAPAQTQSQYQQPVRAENQYQQPARVEPRYQQPIRVEPQYSQPIRVEAHYQAQVLPESQYRHNSSFDRVIQPQMPASQQQRRSKDAETNTPMLRELLAMNPDDYNYPVEKEAGANLPQQRPIPASLSPPAAAAVAQASFSNQSCSAAVQTVRSVNPSQPIRTAPDSVSPACTDTSSLPPQIAHRLEATQRQEVPEDLRKVAKNIFLAQPKERPKKSPEAVSPLYVNPKQYPRIMKRRSIRLRMEAEGRITNVRRKYMHESRHLQALRRHQECRGKFRRLTRPVGTATPATGGVTSTMRVA